MAGITAFRIAGLKVGRFHDALDDITFRTGLGWSTNGNTLINLANGRGKSSMILALEQVFRPCTLRSRRSSEQTAINNIADLLTQRGDHYFAAVEFALDEDDPNISPDGNRLLAGIAMRRKSDARTQGSTKDRVDYYTFIASYGAKSESPYSIENIPFKEISESGRSRVATYDSLNESDKKCGFEVFGGSDSATRRYLDTLMKYGVDARTLAKSYALVGATEGGIGDWAKNELTTVEKLMRYLVDVVVEKEELESSNMAQSLLEQVKLFESRKDNDKKRKAATDALPHIERLISLGANLVNSYENIDAAASDLNAFVKACESRSESLTISREEAEKKIEKNNATKLETEYHLESLDYFEKQSEAARLADEHIKMKDRATRLDKELEASKHRKRVLQCAIAEDVIKQNKREMAAIKARIASVENDSDKAAAIARCKLAANRAASVALVQDETTCVATANQLAERERDMEDVKRAISSAETNLKNEEQAAQNLVGRTQKEREDIERELDALGVVLIESLSGSVSTVSLEEAKKDAEHYLKDARANMTRIQENINVANKTASELREAINVASVDKASKETAHANAERACVNYAKSVEAAFAACDAASIDARTEGFTRFEDDARDLKAKLLDARSSTSKELDELKGALSAARSHSLHLSNEAKRWFDDRGIGYTTGEARFASIADVSVRDAIIKNHPEMLYSVVLDDKQYAAYQAADKSGWQQSVVPIIRQSDITKLASNSTATALCDFLARPNRSAVENPEGFKTATIARIETLDGELARIKRHDDALDEAKAIVRAHLSTWSDLDGRQGERLDAARIDAKRALDEATAALADLESKLGSTLRATDKLAEDLATTQNTKADLEGKLATCERAIVAVCELNDNLRELQEHTAKAGEWHTALERYTKRQNTLETEIKALCSRVETTSERMGELRVIIDKTRDTDNIESKNIAIDEEFGSDPFTLFEQYEALSAESSTKLKELRIELKGIENSIAQKTEQQAEYIDNDETALAEGKALLNDMPVNAMKNELRELNATLPQSERTAQSAHDEMVKAETESENASSACNKAYSRVKNKFGEEPSIPDGFTEQVGNALIEKANKDNSQFNDDIKEIDADLKKLGDAKDKANKSLSARFSKYDIDYREDIEVQLENDLNAQLNDLDLTALAVINKMRQHEKSVKDGLRVYTSTPFVKNYIDAQSKDLFDSMNAVDSTARAKALVSRIESTERGTNRIIEALNADLAHIDEGFEHLVEKVMLHVQIVYDGLQSIERHSRIRFEGDENLQTTLQLNLPPRSETVEGDLARGRVKEALETIVSRITDEPKQTDREKLAKASMSSFALFSVMVKVKSLNVKKIQASADKRRRMMVPWSGGLSGAENMLAAAVVLTASTDYLMSTDVSTSKRSRTVLILDNPYGEASSDDILKPFYDLARQTKTQIIAFSDHSTHAVTSGIDARYSLKARRDNKDNVHIVLDGATINDPNVAIGQDGDVSGKLEAAVWMANTKQDALF